ncbi:MAG: hypothetical protein M3Z00_04320 [Actinomycetota bacterium]|nr:hypothetical protein [Actinomycetota bacterium]
MERRRGGLVLIVLTLLVLVVVNRILARDVDGKAVAVPPIPPPAVGSCVARTDDPVATVDPIVDCSVAHAGEVVQSWPAREPVDAGCSGGVVFGWQLGAGSWSRPMTSISTTMVTFGGIVGWSACVEVPVERNSPSVALLHTGSLVTPQRDGTAAVGLCFEATAKELDTAAVYDAQVDCASAHTAQRVGEFFPQPQQQIPAEQCASYARRVVNSTHAFSGAAALLPRTGIDSSIGTVTVRDPGDGSEHAINPGLACDVLAAPGRQLVGSVVGLGDKPLPYR